MPEDLEWREQANKRALNLKRSNFQVKTFSFNEKETSEGPDRKEQAHKLCPQPWRPNFEVKNQEFQVKNQPDDGYHIKGPCICVSVTNIKDCT